MGKQRFAQTHCHHHSAVPPRLEWETFAGLEAKTEGGDNVAWKSMFISLGAALCVFAFCGAVFATDLPRIMIVGEDVDPNTIPRDSRVFKRVLNAISNQLLNQGFDVKDETAHTYETHVQGRVRRADDELIQIGKDVGVDVLVIFSIYPNGKIEQNSARVTARADGRLLDVHSGSRMGNFEYETQQSKLVPRPFTRNDILETVGDLSRVTGMDVGAVLAQRLAGYVDQAGGRLLEWIFVFDGFTADDILNMEPYWVLFSGYDSHRPKPNGLNTPTHHEYLYKSAINSAKLQRNVYKMLQELNLEGQLYMSGNEVKVVKVAGARQRRSEKGSAW